MPPLSHTPAQEITRIEQLLDSGHFKESLQRVETLEHQTSLSLPERLTGQLLKSRLLTQLGEHGLGLELAEAVLEESQRQQLPIQVVDALIAKIYPLIFFQRHDEALAIVEQLEQALTLLAQDQPAEIPQRKAWFLLLKGYVDVWKGNFDRAIHSSQQSIKLWEELGNPLRITDALRNISLSYNQKGELDRALDYAQQRLELCKELNHKLAIANANRLLGTIYKNKGDDRGLEYVHQGLVLFEELGHKLSIAESHNDISYMYGEKGEMVRALEHAQLYMTLGKELGHKHIVANAHHNLSWIYRKIGDLEQALKHTEQALTLRQIINGWHLENIGIIYYQIGELEQALTYLEQSMDYFEELGFQIGIARVLFFLVAVTLDMDTPDRTRHYVQHLQQLNDQVDIPIIRQRCRVAEALVLKVSPRFRHQVQAQELLEQVVAEEVVDHDMTVEALLHLSELLLTELRVSGDSALLGEVQTHVSRLQEIAQPQHMYWVLAESYVLQAKLALVELDLPRARHLFAQAQQIAEDRGLRRLAMQISTEHDALLTQLDQWQAFSAHNATLRERAEVAQVETLIGRMIRPQAADIPEPTPEIPVLLLIFGAETGLSVFSKQFRPETPLDEHLIAGFLTAMNAFGQDAFAAGPIERIMYADYTVLLRPVAPFLMCYVIQGDSYYALQKFTQFVTDLHTLPSAWESLLEVLKVGRGPLVRTRLSLVDELAAEIFGSH